MRVLSGSLKIIFTLHIHKHISLDTKSCLYAQSIISGYRTLAIKNLIKDSVRTAYNRSEFTLRNSTCLKLILHYFTRMNRRRGHQIIHTICLCIFHTKYYSLVMITYI